MAGFLKTVLRRAIGACGRLVIGCVLVAGVQGCAIDDIHALPNATDPASALVAAGLMIPVAANEIEQAYRDRHWPPRTVQAIRGRVTDLMGTPLEATLTVRVTDRFTAAPERLASHTLGTRADGRFDILIGAHDVVCVDVTAAGKQPVRRWFIVLREGVTRTLPQDLSEIVFVSPSYETDGKTEIRLDGCGGQHKYTLFGGD